MAPERKEQSLLIGGRRPPVLPAAMSCRSAFNRLITTLNKQCAFPSVNPFRIARKRCSGRNAQIVLGHTYWTSMAQWKGGWFCLRCPFPVGNRESSSVSIEVECGDL
ncbi:hypothetical protein CEXT_360821 [Caerostris extrusa]|uniref:Uncharacterized protein n=1 Tax=Caerostris extrusa TaxID=172846 RepID=A0AAV4PBP2_CAEEX|nr:hypothetical protein CEXT_360821 [Caerostris extrusa]